MAKEEKKRKIEEVKAPIPPVSPLFSNVTAIASHADMVMLDFGFVAPSYCEPHDLEDNHISRICLDWDAAGNLASRLEEAISEHKKDSIKKKGAKGTKGENK